jgi:serine/threonine protein kinase
LAIGPGRLLDGKFRILRCIGSGGMGTVWEAEHEFLRRNVAIKVLAPTLAGDESAVRRFFREAHPVVGLRCAFTPPGDAVAPPR